MSDSSLDCLVVGAGISGLASAWFLARRGASVRVLETANELGGVMHSVRDGGFLVETGPNSTLARGGAFDEIVHGLGLAPELLTANRAARRRSSASSLSRARRRQCGQAVLCFAATTD